MRNGRRRILVVVAIAGTALLSLAAAACGSGNSNSNSTPSATAAATSMAETPAVGGASATAAGGSYSTPAAGGGAPSSTSIGVGNTSLGSVLVDGQHLTLYVFSKDTAGNGKSACAGTCATTWPPLIVTSVPPNPTGASGKLATITRTDGTLQLTYNGMPLYRYAGDKSPGDTSGNGIAGVWSVAKP